MWWIKADGVDVMAGLGESVRKEWSGDVDLNDGKVNQIHDAYLSRLKAISDALAWVIVWDAPGCRKISLALNRV